MQKILHLCSFILLIGLLSSPVQAQTVISFEEFLSEPDSFLNASDGTTEFVSFPATFPTKYNTEFNFWEGPWGISSMRDSTTSGFGNLSSARPGAGAEGSLAYAVATVPFGQQGSLIRFAEGPIVLKDVQITNNTYAHNSMRDGDMFAKKFGGETGMDEDFFLLTIKGYFEGELTLDSVDFYLADYRFADTLDDYIVKDWQTVELNTLGAVDSLLFQLRSSDVGANGMNTPAFFCLDDLRPDIELSQRELADELPLEVFPTIARKELSIRSTKSMDDLNYRLLTQSGQVIRQEEFSVIGQSRLELPELPSGMYYIQFSDGKGLKTQAFIVQ
ncbi:MAG: DUF4465 domain-containing protein [Bacteroidota bacterium]